MNERIVFFGTPGFAAYQLRYLLEHKMPIVGVVTTPDRPQGRGRKLQACEVKLVAQEFNLPILEPQNLKSAEFNAALQALKPTLQIVVAFRMLPEIVWALPKLGTMNLHASLLPNYRGAAPINHVIINGEKESGASTFLLKHEIDTGNILLQEKVAITPEDNAGTLHDKIMHCGAPLLLKSIQGLVDGSLKAIPQEELLEENQEAKHAPKIFKPDCLLSCNSDVESTLNKIKGLSPYPAAFFNVTYQEKPAVLKIFKAVKSEISAGKIPVGTLQKEGNQLLISLQNGVISIEELQISGKQRMNIADFLRGIETNNLLIQP